MQAILFMRHGLFQENVSAQVYLDALFDVITVLLVTYLMNAVYYVYYYRISLWRNLVVILVFGPHIALSYLNIVSVINTDLPTFPALREWQVIMVGFMAIYGFSLVITDIRTNLNQDLKSWFPAKLMIYLMVPYVIVIVVYSFLLTQIQIPYQGLLLLLSGFIVVFGIIPFQDPQSVILFIKREQFNLYIFDRHSNLIYHRDLYDIKIRKMEDVQSIFLEQLYRSEEIGMIFKSIDSLAKEFSFKNHDETEIEKLRFKDREIYVTWGSQLYITIIADLTDEILTSELQRLVARLELEILAPGKNVFPQQQIIHKLDQVDEIVSQSFRALVLT